MAQSSREKQEAFRARMAMLGMREVRGIYLPPELHAVVKKLALELLAGDAVKKLETPEQAESRKNPA